LIHTCTCMIATHIQKGCSRVGQIQYSSTHCSGVDGLTVL
jgi:hypothetical protein